MSFDVQEFANNPRLATLAALKKSELLSVANHYKVEVSSTIRKADLRKAISQYLVDEEIVSDEDYEPATDIELKKLELRERERERESQMRIKELEIRERELSIQLKAKELEVARTVTSEASRREKFDMSKHIRFVPPFQDTEVDKYFLHFEKIASSLEWPKEVWTLLLQSVLLGKAREVYSALSVDQSSDYDVVKAAILKAYELVPEAYRQQFRGCRKEESQTYVEFARTKENLFDRWCTATEVNTEFIKLRQLMLLEEFKSCLPSEIKTHLDERRAEDLRQAAIWADDYALTHKASFKKIQSAQVESVNKASGELKLASNNHQTSNVRGKTEPSIMNAAGLPPGPVCFYCKKRGHVKAECRALQKKNAKTLTVTSKSCLNIQFPDEYAPFISSGKVSLLGSSVKVPVMILRDTGAAQSLISEGILPFSVESATGEELLLQGVELGHVSVPLHNINLECDLVVGPVTIGVRPQLPVKGVAVILGNDLAGSKVTTNNTLISATAVPSCPVTRAMAKSKESKTIDADVTTTQLIPAHDISVCNFTLSRQELIKEQNKDAEIRNLYQHALDEADISTVPRCYFLKEGVLMRKWRPPTIPASQEWNVIYQIIIPQKYRETVLSLAHDTPMAGHMGVGKTHRRVLQYFYWPGISRDIKQYCRSCRVCQSVGKPNQNPAVAPLKPISVAGEPFSHVIIDCVGPLPKTREGNQYLLTIMCGNTRFPEAFPLWNIKAPKIVKALIKFFTLFGLPQSVQSDQGSNFMSGLFQEVMFQLGVKQFKSSAYHPQSQGALERFHQTLKSMIRTYCFQEKKDWDEGIPLLLFAVREAVQTSLGFSPFELVFGHNPRGPLKLLKEAWLNEDHSNSLLTRISDVRFKLQKANRFAQENMKNAQLHMKTWYDKKARARSFKPGEKVMVLLPLHGNPLQARFCGPFTILEKLNDVDYIVSTPGRRKSKQLCHINMLKPYYDRKDHEASKVTIVIAPVERDSPEESTSDANLNMEVIRLKNSHILNDLNQKLGHLIGTTRQVIEGLLLEFVQLFPDAPGRTTAAIHDVDVGEAIPIKQHAYRVNPVK